MIERVLTLKTEPEVGRMYLVPYVLLRGEIIPVFGELHEDLEFINFPEHHWHYDYRFVGTRIFNRCKISKHGEKADGKIWNIVAVSGKNASLTGEKVMRCKRRMPHYDASLGADAYVLTYDNAVDFVRILENAYDGKAPIEKNGRQLCPHRGLPLDGLPIESDGGVTCRGHGIRIVDGKVTPRLCAVTP